MEKPGIIIVEDDPVIGLDLVNTLKRLDYNVLALIESGQEAIDRAAELKPDLMLMDIILDGPMNGIDAVKKIHEKQDIPVIYLTAQSDARVMENAIGSDPLGYLVKPIEYRNLHIAIETALNRHRLETELKNSLLDSEKSNSKIAALLKSSQTILKYRNFNDAAVIIFNECRELIGARAGYVAILNESTMENEVIYLNPGDHACSVQSGLPMPVRGLRSEAYEKNSPVYENNYQQSPHNRYIPYGHIVLENALFAPLTYEGKSVGLLGLGNKPGGFTDDDAGIAGAFSELASISLMNNRYLEKLEGSERLFRTVAETATDGIITADRTGTMRFLNRSALAMFGYSENELVGSDISIIIPEGYREKHRDGFMKFIHTGQKKISGRIMDFDGLKKDGIRFPVELTISPWEAVGEMFFTAILRDTTDQKKAEEELKLAQKTAEEASRAKSEFLARMSHELRTPLNAVMGFSQILELHNENLTDKQKEYITYIRENGEHLLDMINDVLDLSKIEAGKIEIILGPFDIGRLLGRGHDIIKAAAYKKNITMKTNIGQDLGWLNGDEKRIKQILYNLLSNAVKFTDEDKEIGIDAWPDGDFIIISIWDQGIGILENYMDRIFQPFEQVSDSSRVSSGTGLGLSITKRLVGLHNGTITIESRIGQGSRFTVKLPGRIPPKNISG